MMRVLAALFLLSCAWTLSAQDDDKPPVLKRGTPPAGQSSKDSSKSPTAAVHAVGEVRRIDDKSIEVEAEDTRILTCQITARTEFRGPDGKISASDVGPGSKVRISATANEDMDLTATLVVVETMAPTAEQDDKRPTILTNGAPDNDRPVLHRGIPVKRASKDDDDDTAPVAAAKPAPTVAKAEAPKEQAPMLSGPPRPVLIEKAREANEDFIEHLPNFVCQQFTARFERISKAEGWRPKDVISANVTYVDGKERYGNIKVGNRTTDQDMMGIKGGARSIGEFGSVLRGLLSQQSDGEFRYVRDEQLHNVRAKVYDFTVKHENSDWQILLGGESFQSAYSGRVWIEKDSARVLRIERQSDNIPEAFPVDLVEQTIDYDYVMIAGKKYLLPTQSENLGCQRGSSYCTKNVIDFRNYQQFRGEATIQYEGEK
jgi:hypothetical protein